MKASAAGNESSGKKSRIKKTKSRRGDARRLRQLAVRNQRVKAEAESIGEERCPANPVTLEKVRLPTHVWHAKRAKMKEKWGYYFAETPSLKCHRITYFAAARSGCVGWDTSYHGWIGVTGRKDELQQLLDMTTLHECSIRLEKTSWEGWIYEKEPILSAVAPVMIISAELPPANASSPSNAELLIRTHPSFFVSIWTILASRMQSLGSLTLTDHRTRLGSFLLLGPQIQSYIFSALSPSPASTEPWDHLSSQASPLSLPLNSTYTLSLTVPSPSPKKPPGNVPVVLVPHSIPPLDSTSFTKNVISAYTLLLPMEHTHAVWNRLMRPAPTHGGGLLRFAGERELDYLLYESGTARLDTESSLYSGSLCGRRWKAAKCVEETAGRGVGRAFDGVPADDKQRIFALLPSSLSQKLLSEGIRPNVSLPANAAVLVQITIHSRLKSGPFPEHSSFSSRKVTPEQDYNKGIFLSSSSSTLPPEECLLGYVTEENYSLRHGKEVFVGVLAWKKAKELGPKRLRGMEVKVWLGERGWRGGRLRLGSI